MSIDSILDGLNKEQLQAATTIDGAVRLIAGAGSGKTHTLTRRVAYICEKTGTAPDRVLSLTFTNKAAAEMKERVAKQLGVGEDTLNISTFHSLAYEIVKDNIDKFGWSSVAIAEMSASTLVALFFSRNKDLTKDLSPDEVTKLKAGVKNEVSKALQYGYYAHWLDKKHKVALAPVNDVLTELDYKESASEKRAAYRKNVNDMKKGKLAKKTTESMVEQQWADYTKIDTFLKNYKDARVVTPLETWVRNVINQKSGKCSFDDMILLAVYLLENYDDVRDTWSKKYDYIQVDEFQDTDSKQLRLVKQLYARHGNLFVVGDPDQSIYLFRGAEPTLFNKLEEYIPNLKTIFMVYNYRSTDEIVKISDEVIKLNKNRIQKECESKRGSGNKVKVLMETKVSDLVNREFEAIKNELAGGKKPEEIAVLYRKNGDVVKAGLIQKLKDANIPYAVAEETSRYTLFTMALCKYNFRKKEEYLIEAINVFNRSPFTFNGLIGIYTPYRFSKVDLTVDAIKQAYTDMINDMAQVEFGKRPETVAAKVAGYLAPSEMTALEKEAGEVINKWKGMSDDEKKNVCIKSSEMLDTDMAEEKKGIQFVTMHKSKGLEWPVVFVNSLTADGMAMVGDGFEQTEEYARLAYVAYSRAKAQLYLCYASETITKRAGQTTTGVAQVSGVLSQVLSDKLEYEGDKELIKQVPEMRESGIKYYMGKMQESFEPFYTPLVKTVEKDGVKSEETVGYRYTMIVDGEVRAFQAGIEQLTKLNCIPNNKYLYFIKITKPLEVRKVVNGHLFAFDEMYKTIKVCDCKTDDEVIAVFKGGTGEKFGLDTKDVVTLRERLKKAEYGKWEKNEPTVSVKPAVKSDVVPVKPDVTPIKQKVVKQLYYRVLNKETKQEIGTRLVRGNESKDINIPCSIYVKQNDMTGWTYGGEVEVTVKRIVKNVNKTYVEVQAINDAHYEVLKKDKKNFEDRIYRIMDVELGKNEALIRCVKVPNAERVCDINDIIGNVITGKIYVSNISKLCNWRGFKRID